MSPAAPLNYVDSVKKTRRQQRASLQIPSQIRNSRQDDLPQSIRIVSRKAVLSGKRETTVDLTCFGSEEPIAASSGPPLRSQRALMAK